MKPLIIVLLIAIIGTIVSFSHINIQTEQGKKKLWAKPDRKLKIIRILPKRYGNSREIALNAPPVQSSRLVTNTDLLLLIDEHNLFFTTLYKTEFTKDRLSMLKKVLEEYNMGTSKN
jgi:hypothetical protein